MAPFGGARAPGLARQLIDRFGGLGGALDLGARQLIVAHNHPSGDCSPSADDRRTTQDLMAAANALEIRLVDHLIVSRLRAFSFAKGGLL